jgi:hypothetical protein
MKTLRPPYILVSRAGHYVIEKGKLWGTNKPEFLCENQAKKNGTFEVDNIPDYITNPNTVEMAKKISTTFFLQTKQTHS